MGLGYRRMDGGHERLGMGVSDGRQDGREALHKTTRQFTGEVPDRVRQHDAPRRHEAAPVLKKASSPVSTVSTSTARSR